MNKASSFSRDILTLSSVPLFSQFIGIFLTPIITRLYSPEAFALQNIFGSTVMIIAVFSTMGYHNSIILPKSDDEAFIMFYLCILSTIIISTFVFIIVLIGQNIIVQKFQYPGIKLYIWLAPIIVFLHGMYQSLRFWNTRLKLFGRISASRVIDTISNKGFILFAGLSGFTSGGSLIFGNIFASFLKNIILANKLWGKNNYIIKNKINRESLTIGLIRYRKFPIYSIWSEFLSRVPAFIIVFLILYFFNKKLVGYYSLSLMVLSMPTILIVSSIMEAFSPRAALAKYENKHSELLLMVNERVFSLSIFPFIILGIFGDDLFGFVFGSNWIMAGVIAQILVFRVFCEIIFTPALSLTNIVEKQEIGLYRTIANIVVTVLAFVIGGMFNNFYLAILILSVLEGALISLVSLYIMHIIDFPFYKLLKKISYYIFVSSILGILLGLIKVWVNYSILEMFLIITFSTGIYYLLLFYRDRQLRSIFFDLFNINSGKSLR